jgi:hypothetical protein
VTESAIDVYDKFGNSAANASVTMSIAPGTGPTGAHLTCGTKTVKTDALGVAHFTNAACRIDRAGSYRLRVTSGPATRDSDTISVVVGPAAKLEFKAYPAATSKASLSPQPSVAATDEGGNVVTTFPATHVTLGINKNGHTFTCTGGLLVAQTVHGVAQFNGCRQTAVGAGYRLTAWMGNAGVVGKAFTVVH